MTAGTLGRAALDAQRFPPEACDALFAEILIDDEVDSELILPEAVQLDHSQDELVACFRLSRQLWIEGFDRAELVRFATMLMRDRDLGLDERRAFKHVRAKLKHFRYAHALYGTAHRYPLLLDNLAITMGHVQDAVRNRRPGTIVWRAALLRLLLTPPAVRRLRAEGDRLVPTTPASFRALLEADYAALGVLAARRTVTGPAFHAARKRVGRQVSFWNTLHTLAPREDRYRMTRWLSAINGRMGEEHDRLVARRATHRASYGAEFVLPDDIRQWIEALGQRVRETVQAKAPRRR